MKCKRCHHKTRVIRTTNYPTCNRRRRECSNCHARYTSHEQFDDDLFESASAVRRITEELAEKARLLALIARRVQQKL